MTLIVALGNPGPKYDRTRHNIGFRTADELIRRLKADNISKPAFKGELFKAPGFLILKPQTFMNLSGESAIVVQEYYKPDRLVVVHDDLDLPFGALRFKQGGGHGGHNGLKSMDHYCGRDYLRVRMGIGRPPAGWQTADYVLANFSADEERVLPEWINQAADAAIRLAADPLEWVCAACTLKGADA
ncbi:MAG: aminoacyl-tRNA hydrolase [Campylobacterales bacterium]